MSLLAETIYIATPTVTGAVTYTTAFQGVAFKAMSVGMPAATSPGFDLDFRAFLGFAEGATSAFCVSAASQDNVATSNTSSRIAAVFISQVRWGELLVLEGRLTAVTATSFTITWDTVPANAQSLHVLVLGGDEIEGVIVSTFATAVVAGNQIIVAVPPPPGDPFRTHLVLFAGANNTAIPQSATGADLLLGAAGVGDDSGQWATCMFSQDAQADMDTQRYQTSADVILRVAANLTLTYQARRSAMTGLSIEWITAPASARYIGYMMLQLAPEATQVDGQSKIRVGVSPKPTGAAPASHPVSGLPHWPVALLLASNQLTAGAGGNAHARLGFGQASREGSANSLVAGAVAFSDTNALATSSVDALDEEAASQYAFTKVDNNTATRNARATIAAMNVGAFELSWTTNDFVATEICYVSIGPQTSAGLVDNARVAGLARLVN